MPSHASDRTDLNLFGTSKPTKFGKRRADDEAALDASNDVHHKKTRGEVTEMKQSDDWEVIDNAYDSSSADEGDDGQKENRGDSGTKPAHSGIELSDTESFNLRRAPFALLKHDPCLPVAKSFTVPVKELDPTMPSARSQPDTLRRRTGPFKSELEDPVPDTSDTNRTDSFKPNLTEEQINNIASIGRKFFDELDELDREDMAERLKELESRMDKVEEELDEHTDYLDVHKVRLDDHEDIIDELAFGDAAVKVKATIGAMGDRIETLEKRVATQHEVGGEDNAFQLRVEDAIEDMKLVLEDRICQESDTIERLNELESTVRSYRGYMDKSKQKAAKAEDKMAKLVREVQSLRQGLRSVIKKQT